MVNKIIVDTDVAIEIMRNSVKAEDLDKLRYPLAFMSSVSVFELFMRETNLEHVEEYVDNIYSIPFTEKEAIEASEILKELVKKGKPIGNRDIFIAATARANGFGLLTFNKKHFENIPGLQLVTV